MRKLTLADSSLFFFRAPFDRRQVRDEGPCATAIYGLRGGFRAAGGLGRVPPCVGKELVQVGLWAISELSGGGSSRREAAKARWAATARRPDQRVTQAATADGRSRRGTAAVQGGARAARPRPQTGRRPQSRRQPGGSVGRGQVPGTSHAACGVLHLSPRSRLDVGARVCLTKTCERGNNSGIDGELGSMPKREAVRDDLDAPLVGDGHVEVHVG